jgi:hypothetical protein
VRGRSAAGANAERRIHHQQFLYHCSQSRQGFIIITIVAMLERRYDDLEVLVSTDDDADSVATTQRAGTSGHNSAPASAVAATATTTTTTLTVTNRKDDTLVKGARAVVMVVLVVSAAVVASLAYVLLSRHEYNAFQDQVRHIGNNKTSWSAHTQSCCGAPRCFADMCVHSHTRWFFLHNR